MRFRKPETEKTGRWSSATIPFYTRRETRLFDMDVYMARSATLRQG